MHASERLLKLPDSASHRHPAALDCSSQGGFLFHSSRLALIPIACVGLQFRVERNGELAGAITGTWGSGSSGDRCCECGRLFVPCDILSFEEGLHPPDIDPQAVLLEYVHRCFLLQHLEHQINEAEWNTRGDAFKD